MVYNNRMRPIANNFFYKLRNLHNVRTRNLSYIYLSIPHTLCMAYLYIKLSYYSSTSQSTSNRYFMMRFAPTLLAASSAISLEEKYTSFRRLSCTAGILPNHPQSHHIQYNNENSLHPILLDQDHYVHQHIFAIQP